MNTGHPISDEVLNNAIVALSKGESWLAYNDWSYLIDKENSFFFKTKDEAIEFAIDNYSDRDSFRVISFHSVDDLLRQIPYGEHIDWHLVKNPDGNGLYSNDGNDFTNALIDHMEGQQLPLFDSQQKTSFMNKENFNFLADNIKYAGFGENLKADLERNMKEGKPDFQLHFSAEFSKKPFEATLNFRKADSGDMYFFNSYQASLERNNGEKLEQTFYLNKGKGITAKEAFNLLDGRAVQKDMLTKEGQPYKAWIQLVPEARDRNNNFEIKQYHEKYGFDLKEAIAKFPVAELKDPQKEKDLMQSLQKGNIQSVTFEKDGSSHKMFIEADPKFKNVKLYDSQMKMVTKESLSAYQSVGHEAATKTINEEVGNDKKKEVKQEVKPDKQKVEKKNANNLLPKKRERTKKGLGIA